MVNDIRLRRLTEVIRQRVSRAILQELKDPRLGFITVTQVKLAKDLTSAVIFWSIIGTEGDRSKTAHALDDARGYLQSAVAKEMGTRVTPRLTMRYDPSLAKAQKVYDLLAKLRRERGESVLDQDPKAPAGTVDPAGGIPFDDSFEDEGGGGEGDDGEE
ncbi:MAG: 30S ribosome-binding factor RbfA [Planctomycetaceae bacterium]|nr:30S ribosome-binding factor RbfA [Planctomycetota bacterium]NUN52657.1 30S ribosome-binding factor RbfA [Planctomycetaceae bacterium]